jgi:hypothetical protein
MQLDSILQNTYIYIGTLSKPSELVLPSASCRRCFNWKEDRKLPSPGLRDGTNYYLR